MGVRNVKNYLYFQVGINFHLLFSNWALEMLEMIYIFRLVFNVKITENSVIYPFFLNFPLLIWIKSLLIYDDLIRILNVIDKDFKIYF